MKTLFVAFSHNLTNDQIESFKEKYGTPYAITADGGIVYEPSAEDCHSCRSFGSEAEITTLKDENPELQAQMSAIPADATLQDIKIMAASIVAEAVKVGATHFFCTGEPTLTWWANFYAGYQEANIKETLICLQSTTERQSSEVENPDGTVRKVQTFKHVQWREMF